MCLQNVCHWKSVIACYSWCEINNNTKKKYTKANPWCARVKVKQYLFLNNLLEHQAFRHQDYIYLSTCTNINAHFYIVTHVQCRTTLQHRPFLFISSCKENLQCRYSHYWLFWSKELINMHSNYYAHWTNSYILYLEETLSYTF